jgi:hypothetical protein
MKCGAWGFSFLPLAIQVDFISYFLYREKVFKIYSEFYHKVNVLS